MVIGIIGESCVGKSTVAELLEKKLSATVYTGKDYLRMAKNEPEAKNLFQKKLQEAVHGDNIIYVISEKGQIDLLPEDAVRILMTANLDTIKERFSRRTGGQLPAPLAMMLEKKHGSFDHVSCDIALSGDETTESLCEKITEFISNRQAS